MAEGEFKIAEGIDPEKFNTRFRHAETHRIDYTIYSGKTTLLSEFNRAKDKKTYHNAACFGSMLQYMRTSGRYNVKYVVKPDPNAGTTKYIPMLTPIEIKKWFQITRLYRLLPKNVRFFSKNSFQHIIVNMKEWPISLSYMFLVVFRYVREDPGLVRAIVHLVDEVGIDPYAAFVVAHRCCTNTIGHSVLKDVRGYLSEIKADSTFDLALARKLRKFVNDPWKYDKRDVTRPYNYRLQTTIEEIPAGLNQRYKAPVLVSKIRHPKITQFVYEKDPKKANKLYNEIITD